MHGRRCSAKPNTPAQNWGQVLTQFIFLYKRGGYIIKSDFIRNKPQATANAQMRQSLN
jgi:hypothetical protein